MNKNIIAIVVGLIALAAASFFGINKYRDAQFNEKLVPIVKASTVRVNAIIELQGAEKVTWKEVFDRADSHVADMEKLALQLKELSPEGERQISAVASADTYLKSAQAFVRAHSSLTRAMFQWTTSQESVKELLEEKVGAYGYDFWKRRLDSAQERRDKAMKDTENAVDAMRLQAAETRKKTNDARVWFPETSLLDDAALAKIETSMADQKSKSATK